MQFAITVTVKPSKLVGGRFYDSLNYLDQYRYLKDTIHREAYNYSGKRELAIVNELIFEHHEEGKARLHAHGLVTCSSLDDIDDLVQQISYEVRTPNETRHGYNVCVKQIFDLQGWKKYIHKNMFDPDQYMKQLEDPDAYFNEVEDRDELLDTNIIINYNASKARNAPRG